MPRTSDQPEQTPGGFGDDRDRLLRYGHIFSSVFTDAFDRGAGDRADQAPLHRGQIRLLRLISRNGSLRVCEAAEILGVSAPAASRSIDKLQRLGLVDCCVSDFDRRTRFVSLNERGRHLIEQVEADVGARLDAVVADLPPEELRRFSELLARFSVALLRRAGGPSGHCLRCAAHLSEDCAVSVMRGSCPLRGRCRSPMRDAATMPGAVDLQRRSLDESGLPRNRFP